MTRKELELAKQVLEHIKNPDHRVKLVLVAVDRDIKLREAQRFNFQIEQSDYDF